MDQKPRNKDDEMEPPLPRRRGYGKKDTQAKPVGTPGGKAGGLGGLLGKGGRGGGWAAVTGPGVLGGAETPRGLMEGERGLLAPRSPVKGGGEGGEEEGGAAGGYRSTRRGLAGY